MSLTRQRGKHKRCSTAETILFVARADAHAILVDSLDMAARIYQARQEAEHGASEERERCLRIARQYPDNLMAREIARQISSGFSPTCK